MINETIELLRKELNQLIEEKADFEEIRNVSTRLDECMIQYYSDTLKKE